MLVECYETFSELLTESPWQMRVFRIQPKGRFGTHRESILHGIFIFLLYQALLAI